MNVKKIFILTGTIFALNAALLFLCPGESTAQEGQPVIIEESVILTPSTGGLQEREQADLERQYRYEFRQKGIILESSVSTPYMEDPSIYGIGDGYVTEEEKLYRYFGVATVFRKAGHYKRPDDKYVEGYLKNVEKELEDKKGKWEKRSKKDAALLKKDKIKELKEDGIAYYKRGDHDKALLKFADVLALDPRDNSSKKYMEKLKEHYAKEMRAESLAQSFEIDAKETGSGLPIEDAAEEILDKHDRGYRSRPADMALDTADLEDLIIDKKADSLLDHAEQDFRIREIISEKKDQERRSRSFTLGVGDELIISVRDHPELSGKTVVRPDGMLILPLVNETVMVRGMVLEEAREAVFETVKRYVKDPVIYVGINKFSSKIFYVIDETGATPYNMTRMNITLRDALFIADWGDNRALGRVLVIKPHKLHPIVKKVDAFDIVYRGNLSKNIKIDDGDVIYIPQTAASKITDTISDALSPVKQVKDLRDEWLDMRWNREAGWRHLMDIPQNPEESTRYSGPGGFD
jgi:polysaccharide export outer membrane protein